MKSKRSKACDISMQVKKKVYERDGGCCIVCGSPKGLPNAHFIARSKGGLGIEQNIVTLCQRCHMAYDQSTEHEKYRVFIHDYLQSKYEDWNEESLIYRK